MLNDARAINFCKEGNFWLTWWKWVDSRKSKVWVDKTDFRVHMQIHACISPLSRNLGWAPPSQRERERKSFLSRVSPPIFSNPSAAIRSWFRSGARGLRPSSGAHVSPDAGGSSPLLSPRFPFAPPLLSSSLSPCLFLCVWSFPGGTFAREKLCVWCESFSHGSTARWVLAALSEESAF